MKKIIYISVFLFAIACKSQTYIPEGRDIKLISLEGCKKKQGGLPCDSCFMMTGPTGKLTRCLGISEIRTLINSSFSQDSVIIINNSTGTYSLKNEYGTYYEFGYKFQKSGDTLFLKDLAGHRTDSVVLNSGSSCPCCTDILFFNSDTAAYYQGRVNKDEFYLTSADHLEGLGKGIYKQVPENYGWEIFTTDSIYSGIGGLIVKSKNTTRVGFDAAFLGSCRVEAPAVDLHYFDCDSLAIVGGLLTGETYILTQNNYYGFPKNFLKKITDPY